MTLPQASSSWRPTVLGRSRRLTARWRRPLAGQAIVVGLDGSDGSSLALRWAIDCARQTGGEILAVHSMEIALPLSFPGLSIEALSDARAAMRENAMKNLEEWSGPIRKAEVPHRTYVIEGPATEAMIQTAKDQNAGMIVVGRRGLGTFARLLLGSVTHRLIQQSPIPVVVVPPPGDT